MILRHILIVSNTVRIQLSVVEIVCFKVLWWWMRGRFTHQWFCSHIADELVMMKHNGCKWLGNISALGYVCKGCFSHGKIHCLVPSRNSQDTFRFLPRISFFIFTQILPHFGIIRLLAPNTFSMRIQCALNFLTHLGFEIHIRKICAAVHHVTYSV